MVCTTLFNLSIVLWISSWCYVLSGMKFVFGKYANWHIQTNTFKSFYNPSYIVSFNTELVVIIMLCPFIMFCEQAVRSKFFIAFDVMLVEENSLWNKNSSEKSFGRTTFSSPRDDFVQLIFFSNVYFSKTLVGRNLYFSIFWIKHNKDAIETF